MSRSRPRARSGPRWGRVVLLVVLVLLGAGLVFADGYAERRVEADAAIELQRQLATPEPPSIDIEGFPFLTQVATRSIGSVHVVADYVGLRSQQTLTVAHADMVLSDVTTADWFKTMTASHVEGTVRVDYNVLQALAGVPLTYVGDGRVAVVTTTTLVDQEVTARFTGRPQLDVGNQTVTLTDAEITVAGVELPDFTAQALLRALLKPIPIEGLPLGLTVLGIDARDDGVHADLVGDNLLITP